MEENETQGHKEIYKTITQINQVKEAESEVLICVGY